MFDSNWCLCKYMTWMRPMRQTWPVGIQLISWSLARLLPAPSSNWLIHNNISSFQVPVIENICIDVRVTRSPYFPFQRSVPWHTIQEFFTSRTYICNSNFLVDIRAKKGTELSCIYFFWKTLRSDIVTRKCGQILHVYILSMTRYCDQILSIYCGPTLWLNIVAHHILCYCDQMSI